MPTDSKLYRYQAWTPSFCAAICRAAPPAGATPRPTPPRKVPEVTAGEPYSVCASHACAPGVVVCSGRQTGNPAFESRTRVKTVFDTGNVTIHSYRKTVNCGATGAGTTLDLANSLTFCGVGASGRPGSVGG